MSDERELAVLEQLHFLTIELLMRVSALEKLLVGKGIITKEELEAADVAEGKAVVEALTDRNKEVKS